MSQNRVSHGQLPLQAKTELIIAMRTRETTTRDLPSAAWRCQSQPKRILSHMPKNVRSRANSPR